MASCPFFKKDMNIFVAWKNAIKFAKNKKDLLSNSSLFNKHLFWTNLGISVILSGVGDVFIQRYEVKSLDIHRDSNTTAKSFNKLNTFRLVNLKKRAR
jgi:hypothetical protein